MKDALQNYMKSINPIQEENTDLVYGNQYKLFRDGKYIGVATWTQDENAGDSFQVQSTDERGRSVIEIYVADKWELNK